MEIDVKEEQEKIQGEIQQLTVMANQLQQHLPSCLTVQAVPTDLAS